MYILLFATLFDLQSAQLKKVKERTRVVSVAYRLRLLFLINRVLSLTRLRSIIYTKLFKKLLAVINIYVFNSLSLLVNTGEGEFQTLTSF